MKTLTILIGTIAPATAFAADNVPAGDEGIFVLDLPRLLRTDRSRPVNPGRNVDHRAGQGDHCQNKGKN